MPVNASLPKRIAIMGLGLIGGSLALALKRHVKGLHITGFDDPDVLDLAKARGAIDTPAASVEAAVSDAEIVFVAAPLGASLTLLEEMSPFLQAGACVTDVGSVKRPIREQADRVLPEGVEFIGGHPMTGSEKRGVSNADAVLFENAVYVLCPSDPTSQAFSSLTDLIERTGARIMVMDTQVHDEAAARVSHLPQLIAVALVNQIADDSDSARLAAGGFRDMTRIASSSFEMWRDILVGNQGPVLDELARFATSLQRLRNRIAEDDLEAIAKEFRSAADIRNAVPATSKGFLTPLSDVFVYTPDEPGALLSIITALSDAGADVKDIELLKIREGTGGTFRLGFKDDTSATGAVTSLADAGLHAYRL